MKPRICVPLAANDPSDILALIRIAEEAEADLIEIRLDYLTLDPSYASKILEDFVEEASVPMIATNREYRQGGLKLQDENKRIQLLIQAAGAGFQYVDIELTTDEVKDTVEKIKSCGSKPIVSFHDFEKTPSFQKMESIVKSEMEVGAEVCKLVTTAHNIEDSVKCLMLVRKMSRLVKIVCFAMGGKGLLSRMLSPVFGGDFTFASISRAAETAPGQPSIEDLKSLYLKLGVYE